MSASLVETTTARLKEQGAKPAEFKGMVSLTLEPEQIVNALRQAKEAGFNMLSDVFGIDYLSYPGKQGKRFSVVYNLYSLGHNERLFIRVNLDDNQSVPSITPLWRGANYMEREVYDMYGVVFEGHPDLRKIHTPEDLDGHPLRKDFPIGETPTLFNEGRFIDPSAFRAGLSGTNPGMTGFRGGTRKGVKDD